MRASFLTKPSTCTAKTQTSLYISLHLRYMGNENNYVFKLLVTSHQIGQTYPSNCYAYIVLLLLLLLLLYLEMICPGDCCNLKA